MEEGVGAPLGAGAELGPYRLGELLGTGGMGTVYVADVTGRAPPLAPGERVAVKIVHPHLLETPGFFKRFLREAAVGRAVQHGNVVRTFDADALMQGGVQHNFLVMEYVEGQTLRDLLEELDRVPEELCRHVGREIARGLAAIHDAGVVHRDLKPENVLIAQDHLVKVMDLGVARLQDEIVRLSQTGAFVGSLHYAAPEQFGAPEGIDQRADLHALGVVLYELASGRHPYWDEDFRVVLRRLLHEEPRRVGEINPQLTPFFEDVVHTLMAKDRDARFATAHEVAEILEAGESGEWWQRRANSLRSQTKQPLRRVRIPRETAVYGRDDELAKLHALFERARAGDGAVVLVEGEAGIGKTRLVDEFVARLRQAGEDLNFLFGSYPPGGSSSAAGGFSTAFREHLGPGGSASYLTETPLLVPAFDALLRGDATPPHAEPLTRDSVTTCFAHATRALVAERPTVLLIDDLHFAPEDSRNLFAALSLVVPGERLLLVGTLRPGVSAEWLSNLTRLEHTHHLTLRRLGPKDLAALLEDSFRSRRLAEELGYRISVKSDGNPFFAFEIIEGLREGQFIAQAADGSWFSSSRIDQIQIPSSVMDLIQARIADLSDEEKELLEVASCCGFEFDPGLVAEAVGLQRIPALRAFGRIEKSHRLIHSAGQRYVFDHHQIREALYAGLFDQLKQEYHTALGAALETRTDAADTEPADVDGALCVELCEHFLAGAGGTRALHYLDAALDHLEEGYLNDQAVGLLDRTLAAPGLVSGVRRAELLLRQGRRLEFLGRRELKRAALEEARALAEEHDDARLDGRVARSVGSYLAGVGRYDEAEQMLGRALESSAIAGDKRIEAEAAGLMARVLSSRGRFAEAAEHGGRRLALAREIGDRIGEAGATGRLGLLLHHEGRYEEAREHHERHLSLAREIGHRPGEARASANLGMVLETLGRHDEALELYQRARQFAHEIGDRVGETRATGRLGGLHYSMGRYREARELTDRELALTREIGDRKAEAASLATLGPLLVELGRPDDARERLRASLAICREIGARRIEGYALEGLGRAAESLGDTEAAERLQREALALRRELDYPKGLANSLQILGELLVERDDRAEEAVALLDEAVETATRVGVPAPRVLALAHLALLRGDAQAARQALDQAGQALGARERMEARFALWRAARDPADLAEAQRLLESLRDHAPPECHDSLVEGVPLHREIARAARRHRV